MQSLRSRVGFALRRASGTFGTESDEERPPSPAESSIKSTPSKRRRKISIFRPDGKRRQNTSDSPAGTVDSHSHAESLPVGDDNTTLPKPTDAKEAHVEPQPHQISLEATSPVLTTEQEEAMQFLVSQSRPAGEEQTEQTEQATTQIGSETAIPQSQASTTLKTVDTALSSGVDLNASAFEIIPAMLAAQENDGVQKSMER
jgi:hypothetical protein